MRILQINTAVNSGSTGRIAEDIGKTLIHGGYESYIAYGRGNRPSDSKLIKIGSQKDIFSHGLKTLFFDKHGLGSKQSTKAFIKTLDDIKPDAIGLHNIHGYYINYKVLFSYIKSHKIPVLWTFHDCWPFTGHCSYFDTANCMKWQTHCESCPKTNDYPKALVDRSFDNFEDKKSAFTGVEQLKIITPSHWLANHVKQSFLKDYKVQVIHNGIDLETFKPLNIEKTQTKIILGVASTWDRRKGLNDFIALSEKLPEDYKIVLIGLSKKQIEQLPKKIKGIERTENIQELVKWYNKASVFVNPTYVDNFPTTNIEALACGTPVITYNTGGSPEAIDAETGAVVEQGDVLGIFNAILNLDKPNQMELSKKCVNRAKNNFDKKHRYKDYLKIFEKMIN